VGNAFLAMLEKLNLTAEVKPKLKAMAGGNAVEPVAKGEAEVAITTVPGILEIPGVDFVGRLPAELQHYVDYTAGVNSSSQEGSAPTDFIQALTTPFALKVIKSKGLDSVGL
jgi:molybdate transport system substrate-binding protein